jgi:hypothetical protein
MSRTDQLYQRLDELERRLEEVLLTELDAVAHGDAPTFFARLTSPGFKDGRFYVNHKVNPAAELLEDLTGQVFSLKKKLGEPPDEGATGVILFFAAIRKKARDERPSWETRATMARQKADELRSYIAQRRPRE